MTGKLKPCPRCGHPGGLIFCSKCSDEYKNQTDSRELGGDIAGPGGAYDKSAVVIDTRRSVILEETVVAMMDNTSDKRRIATVLMKGRINQTQDHSSVLYLMNADGCAALVTQIMALAAREGGEFMVEFQRLFDKRMEEMP